MEEKNINKLKKIIKECIREELKEFFSKKEENNFKKDIEHGLNLYNMVEKKENSNFTKNENINNILNETYNLNNKEVINNPIEKVLTRDYSELMKVINKKK